MSWLISLFYSVNNVIIFSISWVSLGYVFVLIFFKDKSYKRKNLSPDFLDWYIIPVMFVYFILDKLNLIKINFSETNPYYWIFVLITPICFVSVLVLRLRYKKRLNGDHKEIVVRTKGVQETFQEHLEGLNGIKKM